MGLQLAVNPAAFPGAGVRRITVHKNQYIALRCLNQQQTPARSRQDKVAQKALADMQERSKNLLQAVMKVKKTILDVHDRAMNEQELKSLEKQLE